MATIQRHQVLHLASIASCLWLVGMSGTYAQGDPLPSWNEGAAKQAILAFVQATTDQRSPRFVTPASRIATFDQDGTLWVEHPLVTQGCYSIDRIRQQAPRHPEWQRQAPFRAILKGDQGALAACSEVDWARLLASADIGETTEQYQASVNRWINQAKSPRYNRPYTELIYQPMLEVMNLLRAKGFQTYIVSGGEQDFIRAYSARVYGVPPENVVGTSVETKDEVAPDGRPVLKRQPKLFFVDDHEGKAIGIEKFIGKRPCAAFGNSDGDRPMLEWTDAGAGARLKLLVHHDDGAREYAYGPAGGLPDTKIGTFSDALMNEAKGRGWTVVSMKRDWKTVFPFERR